MEEDPILEASELSFAYPGGERVLRDIDFSVSAGEFVALLGANGCGKTTLFQHFNGLLKPNAGRVLLKGKELSRWPKKDVFSQVGLVFQDPNDQLFAATVYEDVSYGPVNLGLAEGEIAERVELALGQVGMWEYRQRSLHQLSYGQKKRVAIAGILAMRPEIMILDEPTAGLDPRTATSLMRLLKCLQLEHHLTIILSTHEVDIVPVYCDRAYLMQAGRMIKQGTPEEVFSDPETIRNSFLRLPRIAHLWEVLSKRDGFPAGEMPLTIKEARQVLAAFAEAPKRITDEKNFTKPLGTSNASGRAEF